MHAMVRYELLGQALVTLAETTFFSATASHDCTRAQQEEPKIRCFPLEPFFEINPGILCSGIGS